jgi:hypothetical protein
VHGRKEYTDMTFDECMHKTCDHCGEAAQSHRLTPAGSFYCLELNSSGEDHYTPWNGRASIAGQVDLTRIVYTCKVMYLKRSPLSKAMGKAVQGYLSGTVTA